MDSKRERLIAILTNSFMPCNGRFPFLVAIISMFFVLNPNSSFQSIKGAILLTLFIALGVIMTFVVSGILSKTLLKGEASSFTLELPPYRKPKWGQIIVRSVLDRTIFVLGRAIVSAAPAGLLIWFLANVNINGVALLKYVTQFLNPFANLLGLDGVILFAFVLGLPANEIVLPVILMSYMSGNNLAQISDYAQIREVLVQNGWDNITAVCTMIFSLFHWPCATTLLTIKKETKSNKWILFSAFLPTITGTVMCLIISLISKNF